jgi:hypothetical protein
MENKHISETDLVAFFDGELERSRREIVANHVASCPACREILETQTLSRAAIQSLTMSRPSDEAWNRVAQETQQRNEKTDAGISRQPMFLHLVRDYGGLKLTVAAASFVLLIFSIYLIKGIVLSGEDGTENGISLLSASIPFDWGLFLSDLDHPAKESRFEKSYSLIPVSLEKALQATGLVAADFVDRIPTKLKFQSARLVELPGATAAQLDYDWEGSRVVVFYQKKDSGLTFSGFKATPTTVREIPCLAVYCTDYRALVTESEDGIFTVIARRGTDLVEEVVEYIIS